VPLFQVDDDVATLVERLAKKKPFENLTFNDALRRILQGKKADKELDVLLAESVALRKKAPSPNAAEWANGVPELKGKKGLNSWKDICDLLKVETGGDSARRRLRNWVKANRPTWPSVPEV
jgi:hypothetical protein